MSESSFFCSERAQRVFREMFCRLHGTQAAVVALDDLPHWTAPLRAALGGEEPCRGRSAYLPAGYFYSISTPVAGDGLERVRELAARLGASCVLYPVVGDAAALGRLRAHGYTCIPWFFEAIYRPRRGVEADLREQLGPKRLRELLRLTRRYAEAYLPELYRGDEILARPELLAEFDRLHRLNLEKYRHRVVFYARPIVEHMLASELKDCVFLYFSRDARTRRLVQVVLGLLCPEGQEMVLLVGGIDAQAVPPGQNLYCAAVVQLLRWGAERDVREFNLGRGNEVQKLSLGANVVNVLYNCVLPLGGPDAGIAATARAMSAKIGRDAAALESLASDHRAAVSRPLAFEPTGPAVAWRAQP